MAGNSEQLLIRFRGICGHIDLSNGSAAKKKRTVLIRHQNGNGNGNIEHHVPYIEFFADDVASAGDLKLVAYNKPGIEGRFARLDLVDKLEGMEIRLKGIEPGNVKEEIGYQRDVPHMAEIFPDFAVEKSLLQELLVPEAKDVDRDRVAAVFDMPAGRLVAGEPEALSTKFTPEGQFRPRRLARWSDLYRMYKPPLVIQLVPFKEDGPIREIHFKESLRMITIGNEPVRLILGIVGAPATHTHNGNGHNGNGDTAAPVQPTGHYVMYYNLFQNRPTKPPLPSPAQFDGSGCPNNNYP